MNVLIVDDDPAMAHLIAASLRAIGPKIETAGTFAEAKAWLKKSIFHLILLDIGLPDSIPRLTIERISEMREGGAKVVVLTGGWPPDCGISFDKCGADEIIFKADNDMISKLAACVKKTSLTVQ